MLAVYVKVIHSASHLQKKDFWEESFEALPVSFLVFFFPFSNFISEVQNRLSSSSMNFNFNWLICPQQFRGESVYIVFIVASDDDTDIFIKVLLVSTKSTINII